MASTSTKAASAPPKPSKLRVCGYVPYTGEGGKNADPLTAVSDFKLNVNRVRSALRKGFRGDETDPKVLRIFLAPEWTFRKPNTTGVPAKGKGGGKKAKPLKCHAYWTPRELGEILKGLLALSKSEENMLIVGGSILWAQPGKIAIDKKQGFTESVAVVYNTTIVVCNGEIVHIYHKQHEGIDINLNTDAQGNVFGMDPSVNNTKNTATEYSWLHDVKSKYVATVDLAGNKVKPLVSNTFKFRGLKFGIEICIDHFKGVLKEFVGSKTVDVQIVVSCGMELNKNKIVARKGGVALHVDGNLKDVDKRKNAGFGFFKVDETGKIIGLGPNNSCYNLDNKTFVGEDPNISFVYNDLIELDWFKKPKKRTQSVTGVSSAKQTKKGKDAIKGKKKLSQSFTGGTEKASSTAKKTTKKKAKDKVAVKKKSAESVTEVSTAEKPKKAKDKAKDKKPRAKSLTGVSSTKAKKDKTEGKANRSASVAGGTKKSSTKEKIKKIKKAEDGTTSSTKKKRSGSAV